MSEDLFVGNSAFWEWAGLVGEPRHPEHLLYAKPCAGQFTWASSSLPLRLGSILFLFYRRWCNWCLGEAEQCSKAHTSTEWCSGCGFRTPCTHSSWLTGTWGLKEETSGLHIWPLWAKRRGEMRWEGKAGIPTEVQFWGEEIQEQAATVCTAIGDPGSRWVRGGWVGRRPGYCISDYG